MSEKEHDFGSLVCVYAQLLPKIRKAGKAMGYAIAIHGSMQRDLDLLAVPWVEGARPAEEFVAFVAEAVRGYVIGNVEDRGAIDNPTIQPHGRRSWNICWGGRPFIDLSVMPCTASPPSGVDRAPDGWHYLPELPPDGRVRWFWCWTSGDTWPVSPEVRGYATAQVDAERWRDAGVRCWCPAGEPPPLPEAKP